MEEISRFSLLSVKEVAAELKEELNFIITKLNKIRN